MSLPLKKTVEIFYDIVSPYSWIAFEILCRYKQKWDIDIQFQPFLLGGLLKTTAIEAPNFNTRKFMYYGQDLQRLQAYCKVCEFGAFTGQNPLKFRDTLRKGALAAMRVITAVNKDVPEQTEAISREFWMRLYSRGEDILERQSLLEACQRVGFSAADAENMVARSNEYDVKARLKEVTQRLIDMGGFGAPFLVTEDADGTSHMLWGSDRFEILASLLGKNYEGPVPGAAKI